MEKRYKEKRISKEERGDGAVLLLYTMSCCGRDKTVCAFLTWYFICVRETVYLSLFFFF